MCVQGRYVQIVVERQQRERDLREKAEREQADKVSLLPAACLMLLLTLASYDVGRRYGGVGRRWAGRAECQELFFHWLLSIIKSAVMDISEH